MSAPKPDAQAELLDAMGDDATLDALGPDWSTMSAAERARYGRAPVEPDPLFTALEQLGGQDLAAQIERETFDIFDRIEAKLSAMEWKYIHSPEARYRAAVARLATEQATHG
jgi:hypothetical protein